MAERFFFDVIIRGRPGESVSDGARRLAKRLAASGFKGEILLGESESAPGGLPMQDVQIRFGAQGEEK